MLGIERSEWSQVLRLRSLDAGVYGTTADSMSIASGRLPFVFGLHGPTAAVDTACSAALTASHVAASAVQQAECGFAIASAISMKLLPYATVGMAGAGMLSIDGRCKTFDARANGMMRTEGIGTHVLQSSEWPPQMQRLGGAVNCDGRSASITAPNGAA